MENEKLYSTLHCYSNYFTTYFHENDEEINAAKLSAFMSMQSNQ
jgi:hypothetical protein